MSLNRVPVSRIGLCGGALLRGKAGFDYVPVIDRISVTTNSGKQPTEVGTLIVFGDGLAAKIPGP
jgi:hypothetical protein